MRKIFTLLSFVSVFAACTDQNSTGTVATTPDTQVTNALETEVSTNQLDLFDQSSVDGSKNYCSGEVSVYSQNGWLFSTSDDWEVVNRQISHVDFALINRHNRLLFTTSTENISGDLDQYLKAKVELLKSSGISVTDPEKVVINGLNYSLVSAPKSNFGNWQWVTANGNSVTTLSCGAPKGTEPDYDLCLTVVESTQRL